MHRLKSFTIAVWLTGLISIALVWAQARWYAFPPPYLPLCLLLIALAVGTLIVLGCCLWCIACGPHRGRSAGIAVAAALPAAFWVLVGINAQANWSERQVPNSFLMRAAKAAAAAVMCAESEMRYAHRLESERIVMFYNELERPTQDLAEMDRHVARLEDLLGDRLGGKIHWIRGPLLGQSYLSFHGLALGSDSSPDALGEFPDPDPGSRYRGDRHELAHATLDWFRLPGSDPPYVLHEGWAMAQCGDDRRTLAGDAATARSENPSQGIREMFELQWYHRDTGAVYPLGGAFVEFLVRTYGPERFRRFYTRCTPDSFEAECREIYGTSLDQLERAFWSDVELVLSDG